MPQKNSELLKDLIYKGVQNKIFEVTDEVLDRISLELSVIENSGFTDYFILYSRIIEVCNELQLLRSPGRGSSASSLINYCLDITKINPLEHNLIFERFLNAKKGNKPDIDIDIPKGFQNAVIKKLKLKYPEYYSYNIAFLPERETEYKSVIHSGIEYKQHPCGIVILPEKLNNSTFTFNNQSFYITKNRLDDPIYNNKFDILELEYLNRLQWIVNKIGVKYHPYRIPLNDKKVFDLLSNSENENIFQFSSLGINKILKGFKPNDIYDLSIINAIYRPGLIDSIPTILVNKNYGYEKFDNKKLNELFKETYGVLIFQETFLDILNLIAEFTYEEADMWRTRLFKAKSTEFPDLMNEFIDEFLKQIEHLSQSDIDKLIVMIKSNFKMTFQKAHSLSYSIIGYWGAFYKTYFNNEFEKYLTKN